MRNASPKSTLFTMWKMSGAKMGRGSIGLLGSIGRTGNFPTAFGQQRYVLLDQLFVSQSYRGKGIGKKLFCLCAEQARTIGARKIYLCAGSAENTIAFYNKLGCVPAQEPDEALAAEDPNDIQLECEL